VSGPRKPRKRVKESNPARRAKSFARSYHSVERVLFVKGLACLAPRHECIGQPENAHVVTGGMGRKGDYTSIVPLCAYHHAVLHRMGAESFQKHYICYFNEHAPAVEALWLASTGGAL